MGAASSHAIEYEEARKSFSEYEQTKLDEVFKKMSSRNEHQVEVLEDHSFQVRNVLSKVCFIMTRISSKIQDSKTLNQVCHSQQVQQFMHAIFPIQCVAPNCILA